MFLELLHRQSHNRMVVPVPVKWPWGIKLAFYKPQQSTNRARHFPNDILKYILLNENIWISIRFSLKFVPSFQLKINQHWFRKWLGTGQAASHYLNQWWLIYWRIYASIGLNEHQLMAGVTNKNTKRVSCNENIVMLREFPLNIDQRVLLIENHYCFGWMAKCSKRRHTFQITTMTQFSDIYPSLGCEEL